MDANYWSSMQTNRANVPVANVVDLNQPGIMPYSGVEVIPAASLELLVNQQRLAGVPGLHVYSINRVQYLVEFTVWDMKLTDILRWCCASVPYRIAETAYLAN